MTNLEALEETIQASRDAGRIERIDTAFIEAARTIAAELDENPAKASLWREYHLVLERLTRDDSHSDVSLFEELQTEVRDSQKT